MEVIIVTGMSGAGKSQAVNALEDSDCYCVDNIPPLLLPELVNLKMECGPSSERIAAVMDVRSRDMFPDFFKVAKELKSGSSGFRILFLDADDQTLLHRFLETRRPHPLSCGDSCSLSDSIAREREIMKPLREAADVYMDTSRDTSHQLRERIIQTFSGSGAPLSVTCLSFGFKYGIPPDADLVFDMRCLPNPYYIDELKKLTGLDRPVSDYVLGCPQTGELLKRLYSLLDYCLPLYLEQGKAHVIIAFGCTGGRHRSVTVAEETARHLLASGVKAVAMHRDRQ